jgi:hypothetical protein
MSRVNVHLDTGASRLTVSVTVGRRRAAGLMRLAGAYAEAPGAVLLHDNDHEIPDIAKTLLGAVDYALGEDSPRILAFRCIDEELCELLPSEQFVGAGLWFRLGADDDPESDGESLSDGFRHFHSHLPEAFLVAVDEAIALAAKGEFDGARGRLREAAATNGLKVSEVPK